ncbi:Universal stress protein Sll1388 [Planktothrix tepida]|uniref:UspA n=2 Tax=Planktothrix TaxID=54304 RepID=A0A1J1LVN6_9CYAN|nr:MULTISPECIES: universal stress protein [Planktothrix]CAD5931472.1 Universal stress protein Sll1388 [Planktothrix pseudagardhii]CAD5977806.1 Universal stress protein Sll1388 [Planktothrix tepida]CUR36020.1 UspA [Planktothrix tepida PCC 9214]
MFKKILAPLDLSSNSQAVFEQALELAVCNQANLMLLHVLCTDEESSPDFGILVGLSYYPTANQELLYTYQQQWQEFTQKSLDALKSWHQIAIDAGVATEYTQTVGKPGKTICEVAKHWEADLILMGRRGYSALGELLLGSVSQYVVHHGPCSVLIVQSHPS